MQMTSSNCQDAAAGVGNGVAAALRGVDCVAGEMSAAAFGRLFAPGGSLGVVLTLVLTLYVAIFAIALLTGRASVGVRSLTPRMMTLGLVLTFATSWVAYQSVVWNLAVATPDWLAGLLTGTKGSATDVFAQKIDVVFTAIQEASVGAGGGDAAAANAGANAGGAAAPAGGGNDISAMSPEGMMWLGAMLFMLGTVGLLVTTKIALAVLVGLGPVFVVLALFGGTRGLFTGWVKGVVLCALTPLFAVLGGSIMLELAVPILAALSASPGQVDPQAGMAFFMIGAVHVALMVLVLKVAGAMVAGWNVFGLQPERGEQGSASVAAVTAPAATPSAALVQAQQANAYASQARRIDIAALPVGAVANDGAGGSAGSAGASARVVPGVYAAGASEASVNTGAGRMRGIGSRFRAAPPKSLKPSGQTLAGRSLEKPQ